MNRRLALVSLLCLAACSVNVGTSSGEGTGSKMDARGPETWTVDGQSIHIDATYFMIVDGQLQFTVEQDASALADRLHQVSDADALAMALPTMKYVLEHHLHERTRVTSLLGDPGKMSPRIGVALTVHDAGQKWGHRVALTIPELQRALSPTPL